jgi:Fe-S-cluster containining protein
LECSLLIATSVGFRCVFCAKCCLCLWNVHYWLPTYQRHRQHLPQYTQRRPTEVAINNGHTKDTGNIWHTIHNIVPNVACVFGMSIIDCHLGWSSLCILCQSIMDIPKTQATFDTKYTTKMSIIDCHLGWSSLCILWQMLSVSLVCSLLIATSVGIRCVYCAKCCLCLWNVHYWLPPRLVFVVYFERQRQHVAQYTQRRPTEVAIKNEHSKDTGDIWHKIYNEDQLVVYFVPNVACVFGMSIIDCHLGWSSLDDQPRWQSIMDIPKTQATFGTIYTTNTNRGGNQ